MRSDMVSPRLCGRARPIHCPPGGPGRESGRLSLVHEANGPTARILLVATARRQVDRGQRFFQASSVVAVAQVEGAEGGHVGERACPPTAGCGSLAVGLRRSVQYQVVPMIVTVLKPDL